MTVPPAQRTDALWVDPRIVWVYVLPTRSTSLYLVPTARPTCRRSLTTTAPPSDPSQLACEADVSQLLTIKEAAERLGVTTQTLRRWDKSGRLVAKRHPINGYRLYDRDELDTIGGKKAPDVAPRVALPPLSRVEGRFFGGDRRLESARTLIREGRRLVTVVGGPGIGKTRIAHELVHEQPSVAVFRDLSAATDTSDLRAALLASAGFPGEEIERLAEFDITTIRSVQSAGVRLVVLDNFEQLLPAGALTVATWLKNTAAVTFIVTSREPLRIAGEAVVSVRRLPLPVAAQMLQERSVEAGLMDARPDPDAFLKIAAHLDGVPLALELAAPLCAALGASGALSELSSVLDAFPSPGPDRPGRQLSLRAALDWSWELLDRRERSLVAMLGVFRGNFDVLAIDAILGPKFESAGKLRMAVLGLVRKSMLVRIEGDAAAFRFLNPVEAYAKERCQELPPKDLASLTSAHRRYYVQRALKEVEAPGAIRPAASVANLVAAVERVGAHPSDDPACIADTLRVTSHLGALSGHRLSLPRQVELVLAIKDAAAGDVPSEVLAEAFDFLAKAQRRLGDYKAAEISVREGIALAQESQNTRMEAMLRVRLGTVYRHRGRLDEARYQCDLALDRLDREAEPGAYALAQAGLACTHLVGGSLDHARDLLADAIDVAERIGSTRYLALYVGLRGNVEQDDGRLETAEAFYRQALRIHRDLDDHENIGIFTGYLATVFHEQQRWDEAHIYYKDALRALAQAPHARFECLFEGSLGALLAEEGDLVAADAHLNRAIEEAARFQFGKLDEVLRVHRKHLELAGLAASGSAESVERHLEEILGRRDARAFVSDDLRFAYRRIEAAGRRYVEQALSAKSDLQVSRSGAWFAVGESRVDLARRKAVSNLLRHLVELHTQGDGAAATTETLVKIGWPGQKLVEDSGEHRVRVAIWTLRRLGLSSFLVTSAGGYRLRPGLKVHIVD